MVDEERAALQGGNRSGVARIGATCFSGILPPEEADMPTKAKPKKLSTRAERGFKTYRVKSAAEKKPAKANTIRRERFVKH